MNILEECQQQALKALDKGEFADAVITFIRELEDHPDTKELAPLAKELAPLAKELAVILMLCPTQKSVFNYIVGFKIVLDNESTP